MKAVGCHLVYSEFDHTSRRPSVPCSLESFPYKSLGEEISGADEVTIILRVVMFLKENALKCVV